MTLPQELDAARGKEPGDERVTGSAGESDTYAINVQGLRKSYGKVSVLDGIDLRVARGSMLALLGPNGAGKTTAVRILSTLLPADGGTVTIAGRDVARERRAVREVIGLTSQDVAVDEMLTGQENLIMMGRLFRLDRRSARVRAAELLEQFSLAEAAGRPVRTYSGGMRRRLDLAISLITAPPVLFLDEPTNGLDPRSRQEMWDTIRGLLALGTTILLTTQYLDEADQLADRIAVIDKGRIVAEGTATELKSQVGSERLTLGFGSPADLARAHKLLGGSQAGESVSVPVTGAAHVRRLLNELAEHGLDVRDLSLSRPTLDDVFHTLTTHNQGAGK